MEVVDAQNHSRAKLHSKTMQPVQLAHRLLSAKRFCQNHQFTFSTRLNRNQQFRMRQDILYLTYDNAHLFNRYRSSVIFYHTMKSRKRSPRLGEKHFAILGSKRYSLLSRKSRTVFWKLRYKSPLLF